MKYVYKIGEEWSCKDIIIQSFDLLICFCESINVMPVQY